MKFLLFWLRDSQRKLLVIERRTDINNQSGQALLIILLVLAVALTVVLSTASRSVTDIQITSLDEDSLRAFSAAEAGVEEALIQQTGPSGTLANNASYSVDFTTPPPTGNEFAHPSVFKAGESATFWFVSQDGNGNLNCSGDCLRANRINLCWGIPGTPGNNNQTPAIELSVFYDINRQGVVNGNFSGVEVAREVYDPWNARPDTVGFTSAGNCSSGIAGQSFAFGSGNINFNPSGLNIDPTCLAAQGCLLMARVKFLYNHTVSHPVAISVNANGGTNLPAQGATIESTGTSGDATREINVYQSYGEVPAYFDSAVFSMNDLSKP